MAELYPGIGIQFNVLTDRLKESLMRDGLTAVLATALGLLAGSLLVTGQYGVIACMVARRRSGVPSGRGGIAGDLAGVGTLAIAFRHGQYRAGQESW